MEFGLQTNAFGGGIDKAGNAQGVRVRTRGGLEQVGARAGDCGRRVRQVQ